MSAFPEEMHKNYIAVSLFMFSWNLMLTEMMSFVWAYLAVCSPHWSFVPCLSTENAVVVASHSGYLAFLSVSVCHLKGWVHTCHLQETQHAETIESYLVSSLPKQEVFLSAVLLFLLAVRITFSLIHGCRCRMSHVIVVAVGSVKLLLPSSSSLFLSHFHPIFPSVSYPPSDHSCFC